MHVDKRRKKCTLVICARHVGVFIRNGALQKSAGLVTDVFLVLVAPSGGRVDASPSGGPSHSPAGGAPRETVPAQSPPRADHLHVVVGVSTLQAGEARSLLQPVCAGCFVPRAQSTALHVCQACQPCVTSHHPSKSVVFAWRVAVIGSRPQHLPLPQAPSLLLARTGSHRRDACVRPDGCDACLRPRPPGLGESVPCGLGRQPGLPCRGAPRCVQAGRA